MKCPKCGFNSFEYHDGCKKCGNDLKGYKETYGIKPIVLPAEVRASMAAALTVNEPRVNVPEEAVEPAGDMFSFDLPEDQPGQEKNPFDFGDEESGSSQGLGGFSFDEQKDDQAKTEDDAFADLLETTSHEEAPAAPSQPAPASSAGEFDLENFSWDDTPAPAAEQTQQNENKTDDDFNDLFGELEEANKK